MVASGEDLSEGYGHDGPGVCLGDGQTDDEGVPLQGGRGDAGPGYVPTDLNMKYSNYNYAIMWLTSSCI